MGNKAEMLADEIARKRCRCSSARGSPHAYPLRGALPGVVEALETFLAGRTVQLISLMDHTPGQRQFRDIDKYFIYYGGKSGKAQHEIEAIVARRQTVGSHAPPSTGRRSLKSHVGMPCLSRATTTRRWTTSAVDR